MKSGFACAVRELGPTQPHARPCKSVECYGPQRPLSGISRVGRTLLSWTCFHLIIVPPHTPYSALRCVLIPSLLSSVFLHYRDLLLVNDGVFSKYKYNFVTINIKYINEDIRTFLNFENQWLKKGAYNSITIIIYIYIWQFSKKKFP